MLGKLVLHKMSVDGTPTVKIRAILTASIICLLIIFPVLAQTPEPTPQSIEIDVDGTILSGDFYVTASEEPAAAVLLMHQNNSSRDSWLPLIPALLEAGHNVLAVDLRGMGSSDGPRDFEEAALDVGRWLEWLRAQPSVDPAKVSIVGASIGANLAITGCAADADCVTVIALSPGLNYFGVQPGPSIPDLEERSALIIAAHDDNPSGRDVRYLVDEAEGEIGLLLYPGRAHGSNMLLANPELVTVIAQWLETHLYVSE